MYYRARDKNEEAEEEREGNSSKRKRSFRTLMHAKEDAPLCGSWCLLSALQLWVRETGKEAGPGMPGAGAWCPCSDKTREGHGNLSKTKASGGPESEGVHC